jgi:L-iditol 2-dehydrogenase
VTGAGPVGLLCAQVARARGAGHVAISETNAYRASVAEGYGFRILRPETAADEGFDAVIECSGAPAALRAAVPMTAPGARVILVGMGADEISLDLPLAQGRELEVMGTFRYANSYPTALALMASGQVVVEPLVTHRFSLEHAVDALRVGQEAQGSIKTVVFPWA